MVVVEVAVPTGGTHGGQPISAAVYATFATVTRMRTGSLTFMLHDFLERSQALPSFALKTYCYDRFTPTT